MANLSITAADVAPVRVDEADLFTGPAAEAITAGQYVRLNTTTGYVELGNGSSTAEARAGGIAIKSAAVAGEPVSYVTQGLVSLGNALGGLAYGADVYLSDTDGTLADAAGTVSRIVGTVHPAYGSTSGVDKLLRVRLP